MGRGRLSPRVPLDPTSPSRKVVSHVAGWLVETERWAARVLTITQRWTPGCHHHPHPPIVPDTVGPENSLFPDTSDSGAC